MFHVKHSKTFFPIRILSKPNSIPIYFLSTISYLLFLIYYLFIALNIYLNPSKIT